MPDAVIHPTPQELAAFGLGKLPERAAAAVAAHLETCPACRKAVAGVSADSFLNKVRDAKQGQTVLPPSLAQPASAASSAGSQAIPVVPCADCPPELVRHPKYLILRELGRGGMGVVYQARQTVMNRPVVIKVINRALLDRPDMLERFRREIQAAARLSHRNIVTAYDAEQAGELHMLVMEFVPGQSLAEVLEKKGPLPVKNACYYVCQAAQGLQHAHEQGMVHRDIKPQNLMLTPKGLVKILDFGLAKAASERGESKGLTSSDHCMGTPEYIAPEQAQDARSADIRADLYSLGCTLYCLLAGRPPFREDTWVKTVLAHIQKTPPPLRELRPDVPERLCRIVDRLLAKEPAERYQKPSEVVQALAPFVKPGTKPEAKSASALPDGMGSPAQGTVIKKKPNEIKEILRDVGEKKVHPVPVAVQRSSRKKWLIGSVIGAGVLVLALLGMWASGAFNGPALSTSSSPSTGVFPEKPAELSKITNSIGMKFVLVKPGAFLMGSPEKEDGSCLDEPQHKVEITRSFYMGVYEVTQEQYKRVRGENPSYFSADGAGRNRVKEIDTRQFPVENVTWWDADKFCRQLSELAEEKRENRTYRLPTEAEWEYCCRGGHFFKEPSPLFQFGNSLSSEQANFDGNWPFGNADKGRFLERPTKVGAYPANRLGLYDLHGNVREWCRDWYDGQYYEKSPLHDPPGPDIGERRVSRGGSWDDDARYCRSAYRYDKIPGDHLMLLGFRVVLVVGPKN